MAGKPATIWPADDPGLPPRWDDPGFSFGLRNMPKPTAEEREQQRYERRLALADDPNARVMVFFDGQYFYKECRRAFGWSQAHPDVIARELAGPRKLVGTRFYTGLHDPRKNPAGHAAMERRLRAMGQRGVDYQIRTLKYVWEWGPGLEEKRRLPAAGPKEAPRQVEIVPYERPVEKGIDLFLSLDALDLGLLNKYDVAIIVSLDADLTELPPMLRGMVRRAGLPEIRIEAGVIQRPSPKRPKRVLRVLPRFDHTHQITQEMFDKAVDRTNYSQPGTAKDVQGVLELEAQPERSSS